LDSGSSNRNTFGSRTMARPMATRWRWPPESWRGLRVEQGVDAEDARRPRRTRCSISAFGDAADLQAR
jgi:hypothetical protein